jgi:aspartyl-tRNA(Asn)/glutamyl-tRNA(Gln) amidotransferase subunit C
MVFQFLPKNRLGSMIKAMGGLSKKDVLHVAGLANLELSRSEVKKFQKQLSRIIDYINELKEVNTKSVEPTSQTTGLTNALREDKQNSSRSLSLTEATFGTKKIHQGYFVVPALLNKND